VVPASIALETKKDIAFIVRKPDIAKKIALRFHVPVRLFIKLNTPIRKRQLMYAGKQLVIPVWLRRKANANSSDYDLADYQLDVDSLDAYVREDFVCMADIEKDTVRKIVIDKEIRKIDRRISIVNQLMDSIEEVGMQNLSNREIRKMPMERARRAGAFVIGKEIDSLRLAIKVLSDEKAKIDIRVADYEYLIENAPYMASHPHTDEGKTINIRDWGNDLDMVKNYKGKN
jgi:murein DD-endopeptidase MepM/ murein hydrolase activator NlpD